MKRIVVTGGAGFIGSNFVKYILERYPHYSVHVLDKLTYAGNMANLESCKGKQNFSFQKGDICDKRDVDEACQKADWIVNFAAETHVDRSISGPQAFVETDVLGTHVLLEAVREHSIERYVQISTDEVYGSIAQGSFTEESPLNPSSPYAASKAGADLLVLAYWTTHRLPVLITRSSNNYGPYQHPEKFIPLFITNALEDEELPLYGDGLNVRDWLYVTDNCRAVDLILHNGTEGEIYNIGANEEKKNIEVAHQILACLGKSTSLIRRVTDRKGHDRRYSLDSSRIRKLGWKPEANFEESLKQTVAWYTENEEWWKKTKSGEFKEYYRQHYSL
jgi:dTDP-glucose 4,6-dehydratase